MGGGGWGGGGGGGGGESFWLIHMSEHLWLFTQTTIYICYERSPHRLLVRQTRHLQFQEILKDITIKGA